MRDSVRVFWVAALLTLASAAAADVDRSLAELSLGLAQAVDAAGVTCIGVPEFMNISGTLGADTGAGGHYVAETIEGHLVNAPNHRYEIVERRQLNRVLQELKVQASGLTDQETLEAIIGKIHPLKGLVVGSLTRVGGTLKVKAKIVELPTARTLAFRDADIPLDPDWLTLFGASVVAPEKADPPAVVAASLAPAPHPLLDPACPFGLEVRVRGKPTPLHRIGGDLVVPASTGAVYRIRLTNRNRERVGIALLVDGLNTIGGKREVPSSARKWVLRAGQSVEIPGWQVDREHVRDFVFVGADESLAARQQFTDEVGLITAAFYRAAPPGEEVRGSLGTGMGGRRRSRVMTVPFTAADAPAAILTLRYDLRAVVERHPRAR